LTQIKCAGRAARPHAFTMRGAVGKVAGCSATSALVGQLNT